MKLYFQDKQGNYLMSHLNSIKDEFPDKIKEVRGKGLLTAFEMHNEKHLDGHIVSLELLNHGVYAKETHHTTVRLAPALTINKNQIDLFSLKILKNLYNYLPYSVILNMTNENEHCTLHHYQLAFV